MTTQRMDFPDAVEQPVPRRKSEVDRLIEVMHRQHKAQMAVLERGEANQRHLLAIAAGWLVCLGILGLLAFSAIAVEVMLGLWYDSRSSDWSDVWGRVGRFLVPWSLLILAFVLPPIVLRALGFRLFRLKD